MSSLHRGWMALIVFGLGTTFVGVTQGEEPVSAVGPLMKLFQSGRLPAERQGTVVEMICTRGNEHDLRVVFDKLVQPDALGPDVRRLALAGLADAAVTRKVKPAGDLAALESLVVGPNAERDTTQQAAAIRLASSWKDTTIAPALQKLALNPQTKPALQRVALEGLIAIDDAASRAAIVKLAASPFPLSVRMQAIAGWSGFELNAAATAAAQALADATVQDDPAELISAFLNRKLGSVALAEALTKLPPKPDVAKISLRYMYSVGHSDAELTAILSKTAGIVTDAPPPTQEEVAKIVAEVIAKGDATRGEEIFRRKDLSCMKCHSVSRAGGQVGPELSAVGGSSPVDYVVNSILNPNLAVKEQFVTRVFSLTSGKVLTGIVIDRDDVRVNVRDVNGQKLSIPTADIDEEEEGRSLMPQGLTLFLTRAELVDLAKFISELGKPGPYAVQTAKRIQRWRLLRSPPTELTTEVPHLENLRQLVFGAPAEQWSAAYSKVNGVLPLAELRPGASPAVLILQGEVNVTAEGPVRVQIESTETLQTWIGAESLDTKRDATVTLPVGRHPLTFRVEVSDREKPELRVELSVPDGASTNLEVIGGS